MRTLDEEDYAEGKREYDDGMKEYQDGSAEAKRELADAEKKLVDGQREIDDNRALLEDGLVLCCKKGMRTTENKCLKFKYDPCKRIPVKAKTMDFAKYDNEDFSL